MSKQVKLTLLGMLIGLGGNLLGFLLYGLAISLLNGVRFSYFFNNMFMNSDIFRSEILTGSLLVNVIIFYIFMRKSKDELSRGMLITILLTVIAIVYYYQ